ncbi:MAG: cupin domain-containing protein [Promethearchaeota archaeon]
MKIEHFHYSKSREKSVSDYNSERTAIRVFIEKEAPNFIMRRFEIKSGGSIGVHSHPVEHEIYLLKGQLFLTDNKGRKELVSEDEFIFFPPNEPHGYINSSNETAAFI